MRRSPTTSVWPVCRSARPACIISRRTARTRKRQPGKVASFPEKVPYALCLGPALGQIARAQAQTVEADEAGRVALVIPALHAFHRRDLVVVERVFRLPAAGDDVALV